MDALPHLRAWNYGAGYKTVTIFMIVPSMPPSSRMFSQVRLPNFLSLEERAQFTQALSAVTPVMESCEVGEEFVVRKIKSLLGCQVGMISQVRVQRKTKS